MRVSSVEWRIIIDDNIIVNCFTEKSAKRYIKKHNLKDAVINNVSVEFDNLSDLFKYMDTIKYRC